MIMISITFLQMVYDNPYIFYSHVAHHSEEIPKDRRSKGPIVCKWEGK